MIVWTHRGNPGPENTLEAFAQAWKDGISHFETDIHVTKDGILVLAHDPNIQRLTGVNQEISDLNLHELNNNPILGHYQWCTLDSLVEAFPSAVISIDIKCDEALAPFIDWLSHHEYSNLVVGSFSTKRVRAIRKAFPKIRTALTPLEILKIRFGLPLDSTPKSAERYAMIPEFMHGFKILTKRFIASCQSLNIPIYVWTVNSVAEGNYLNNLGVHGIVTDNYKLFARDL
jgi:glycerophosphoryl diester phosphodiesterase